MQEVVWALLLLSCELSNSDSSSLEILPRKKILKNFFFPADVQDLYVKMHIQIPAETVITIHRICMCILTYKACTSAGKKKKFQDLFHDSHSQSTVQLYVYRRNSELGMADGSVGSPASLESPITAAVAPAGAAIEL